MLGHVFFGNCAIFCLQVITSNTTMTHQYVVTLKNTSRRYIDIFSVLLLGVSCLLFILEQIRTTSTKPALLFASLAIVLIVAYHQYQRIKKNKPAFYSSALFIAAIAWVTMPYLAWLFVPFALMGLFERQAKFPLEIGFSDNIIIINTLIRRKYKWSDFNNVVLKDDILTMDFKNNRLFQRETIDEEGDAEEDEFNEYCQERLSLG